MEMKLKNRLPDDRYERLEKVKKIMQRFKPNSRTYVVEWKNELGDIEAIIADGSE